MANIYSAETQSFPASGRTLVVQSSSSQNGRPQKHSCLLCSRRKIKCDKQHPCSSCVKAQAQCIFSNPMPSRRHRRRYVEEDVLARLKRYEDLLRKNNIDTSINDGWVHYGVEETVTGQAPASPSSMRTGQGSRSGEKESNLWGDLSDELRNPSQDRLAKISQDRDTVSPNGIAPAMPSPDASFLLMGSIPPETSLTALHPRPTHIFRLWQIFLDQVNPLVKIIHAPTLQQQILEASENLQNISKEMEALMFVIYFFVASGLKQPECENLFREEKSVLVSRYRMAAQRALIAADFASSSHLMTLQALVLFLLASPASKSSYVLAGVAVRIGQNLGLHQDKPNPEVSVFESEMRIRLWWQIIFLDYRASQLSRANVANPNHGDVRLPLNVNDSDLYPEMGALPMEHSGPTEMLYCLLKYESRIFLQHSPTAAPLNGSPRALRSPTIPMAVKDKIINELEQLYEQKYLRHCDPLIPLHSISIALCRLVMCRMRFVAHHPRQYPDGQASLSREENDMLFATSVKLLELDNQVRKIQFMDHFPWQGNVKGQLDAFIYTLSDLRGRTTGDMVSTAWQQIEIVFEEHPDLINDRENSLYAAICELALSAWEARKTALSGQQQHDLSATQPREPNFITRLLSRITINQPELHPHPHSHQYPTRNTGLPSTDRSMSIPALIDTEPYHQPDDPNQATSGAGGFLAFTSDPSSSVGMPIGNNEMDWTYWEDLMQGQGSMFQALDGDYGRPFLEQD